MALATLRIVRASIPSSVTIRRAASRIASRISRRPRSRRIAAAVIAFATVVSLEFAKRRSVFSATKHTRQSIDCQ